MSGQCASIITPCIVSMFLLLRAINRRDLRSTGISRLIAKPLRPCRSPSPASASYSRPPLSVGRPLPGYYPPDRRCFTGDLWDVPMLAWLLRCRCPTRCCLRPRGAGYRIMTTEDMGKAGIYYYLFPGSIVMSVVWFAGVVDFILAGRE